MPFTLTWDDATELTDVLALDLSQSEGEFATLKVTIINPRVGLLAPGREQWATLSHDVHGDLFYGRLVGVPTDLQNNEIELEFLARPDDYEAQKETVAAGLRVLPWFDPVFIAPEDRLKADTVLEARPAHWAIDRVDHTVSVSDLMAGEDGTLNFGDTVFYDSVKIAYGEKPATLATCTAEVRWTQRATGSIDITDELMAAFEAANSTRHGYIASYTGEGLYKSWPKIGASIGGGWEVGASSIERLDGWGASSAMAPVLKNASASKGGFETNWNKWPNMTVDIESLLAAGGPESAFPISFRDELPPEHTIEFGTLPEHIGYYNQNNTDTGASSVVGFQEWCLRGTLGVKFTADRVRSEQISFTVAADVQPIVSDMSDALVEVDMMSGEVDQPIDDGGALPIGDTRRNSYMLTDRGKQSLAYLVTLCRARLLARARAVHVSFDAPFSTAVGLTLRHSATIADPRLPGGQATGKVIGYSLSLSGDEGQPTASVTIGCMIGRNNTLSAPAAGTNVYADGYAQAGWQASVGSATAVASGDVQYTSYENTPITLGGLDLFAPEASSLIDEITVLGGAEEQAELLGSQTWADTNEAIAALNGIKTQVALALVPVTGDELRTPFTITVSDLMVPKTIDLEAPSA